MEAYVDDMIMKSKEDVEYDRDLQGTFEIFKDMA